MGGREGEPQLPGGLGTFTPGDATAGAQLPGDGGDEEVQEPTVASCPLGEGKAP